MNHLFVGRRAGYSTIAIIALGLGVSACSTTDPEGGVQPTVTAIQEQIRNPALDPEPDIVGAGADRVVILSGEKFAVFLRDLVKDNPTVQAPAVSLVSGTTEIDLQSVRYLGTDQLSAVVADSDIRALETFNDFSARVVNPGGKKHEGGSIRVSPWERAKLERPAFEYGGGATLEVCGYSETPVTVAITVSGSWLKPGASVTFSNAAASISDAEVHQVEFLSDSTAIITLPDTLGAGSYDLRWTNADGQTTIATDFFAVTVDGPSCPILTSVTFESTGSDTYFLGCNEFMTPADAPVTVAGGQLSDTGKLTFTASATVTAFTAVSWVSSSMLDAQVPASTPANTYDIEWIENPVRHAQLGAAFAVVTDPTACGIPILVDAISPPFAWTGARYTMTITGSFFPPGATAALVDSSGTEYALKFPVAITDGEITATFPANVIPAGLYDLRIYGPNDDYLSGTLADAVLVTATRLPVISAIDPEIIKMNDTPPQVELVGQYFDFVTGITTVVLDDTFEAITAPTPTGWSSAAVTLAGDDVANGGALPDNATYIVRLYGWKAEGLIWVDSPPFVVPDANGKPGAGSLFATVNSANEPVSLPVALMDHSALPITDAQGNRMIVVAGGRSTAITDPSDALHVAALDQFGRLTRFRTLTEPMIVGRANFGLIQNGRWLYALGGITDAAGNVTTAIERAEILDPARAPEVEDAQGVSASGADLPAGNWSYRVAAVYSDSDLMNPGGESLGSPLVAVYVSGSANAAEISWPAVSGAESYRIYRNLNVSANLASTYRLDQKTAVSICSGGTCTYTDTGALTPLDSNPVPLESGDTGVWQPYDNLDDPRAAAYWHEGRSPDNTRYLFGIYGIADASAAPLNTAESLRLDSDGELVKITSATVTTTIGARSYAFGGALNSNTMSFIVATDQYIFVAGGYTNSTKTSRTNKTEYIPIQNGGTLGNAVEYTGGTEKLSVGLAASGMVVVSDRWYYFGGDDSGGPALTGRKSNFTSLADFANPSAGADLTVERAFASTLRTMGHIYVFGGTSDGINALDSIEGVAF